MPPERGYEKCSQCHLLIERNDAPDGDGYAEYVHLHTDDDADRALDESHEARPSGESHSLLYWKTYGPPAMRARFVTEASA